MPRKSNFKIKWWKWYLVDVKDWRRPLLVRKHFNKEDIAVEFADKYLGDQFEPIRGYEALDLGVRDYPNIKKKYRHSFKGTTSYKYPPHIKTDHQKRIYRITQHTKRYRMKEFEPITPKEVYYLLKKRPIEFAIRTKTFRNWQWPYSKPSEHLKKYINEVEYPKYVRILTVIEKTLIKYKYDIGPWPIYHVAISIYNQYKSLLDRFTDTLLYLEDNAKNRRRVREELKARGFTYMSKLEGNDLPDNCYVCEKDGLGWFIVYPQWCRLTGPVNRKDKRPYIYDFADLVGIKGFTKCKIPSKYIS